MSRTATPQACTGDVILIEMLFFCFTVLPVVTTTPETPVAAPAPSKGPASAQLPTHALAAVLVISRIPLRRTAMHR